MANTCFCDVTVSSVANCFLEKTSISLPVLITVYAMGYIWAARKKMQEITKQCDVLEKDMKIIKKENVYLVDEIRRIKCTSDNMICTPKADCKRRDRTHSFKRSPYDNSTRSCLERLSSRKTKRRKCRRNSPSSDKVNFNDNLAIPLPDFCNPSKSTSTSKIHCYNIEWSPNAESTRIFDNINDCDHNKMECRKSKRQSFKNGYFSDQSSNRSLKSNFCDRKSYNKRSRSLKNDCDPCKLKSRAKSPKRTRSHSSQLKECKFLRLKPCISSENSNLISTCRSNDSLFANEKYKLKNSSKNDYDNTQCYTNNYPLLLDSTKKIKERIEKCKMEIKRDLDTIPEMFQYKRSSLKNNSKACEPTKENYSCLKTKCKIATSKCK